MNKCQAGHKTHDTKVIDTVLGDMTVFDYDKYMNFPGYCTGQDAVSDTLEKTKSWDIKIHERVAKILIGGDRSNLFIDIGCHIGYFSKIAQNMGYPLIGYDADAENLKLFKENVPNGRSKLIWFDENVKPRKWCDGCSRYKAIELMKLDIEGAEQHAIQYYHQAFDQKAVKNVVMEVSPIFNDSYPELDNRMLAWGFTAYEMDGSPFNGDWDFEQRDLWYHL